MRKSTKLMAGLGVVAGLGVALAPLATFADPVNMGSDALTVNVNSSCTLATAGTPAEPVVIAGHWEGTGNPGSLVPLTGADSGDIATVTFNCTENSRVAISATAEDLENGDDSTAATYDTIAADQISATYTGANGMDITAAYDGAYGALDGTAIVVAEGTATASGNLSFTVGGYKAQLKPAQKAGTYTGDVTYSYVLVND